MLSWLLVACIPVAAVALRLLAGDDEPDNVLIHQQENEPRRDPDAELAGLDVQDGKPGPALMAA